ncbi:uncharacterized protein BJX67DRAFT_380339 [Aspergillus lucknowensis]|uniref:D-isomer specific 2-hydroxyacid dehydrogenase NAD-binding domain-containing protein n=1 Tax=Aspergillus lucknowensis TaxID=176173 RepID=A0ABR4LXM5_9EURO
MRILYHDLVRKGEEVERGVGTVFYAELDGVLGDADCVVVATPLVGRTLLAEERFVRFKRGGHFANSARGLLGDDEASVQTLDDGRPAGKGMDVHANEPYVHPRLAIHPKVMMMSHNAGSTVDTHIGFEGFLHKGRALTLVNAHLIKPQRTL